MCSCGGPSPSSYEKMMDYFMWFDAESDVQPNDNKTIHNRYSSDCECGVDFEKLLEEIELALVQKRYQDVVNAMSVWRIHWNY
jgi:hypothetical protein